MKGLLENFNDEFEREKYRTNFFELFQVELSRAFSIQFASSPFDVEFHLEFVGKVCHKMETVCEGGQFNKIGPTCNYETSWIVDLRFLFNLSAHLILGL